MAVPPSATPLGQLGRDAPRCPGSWSTQVHDRRGRWREAVMLRSRARIGLGCTLRGRSSALLFLQGLLGHQWRAWCSNLLPTACLSVQKMRSLETHFSILASQQAFNPVRHAL